MGPPPSLPPLHSHYWSTRQKKLGILSLTKIGQKWTILPQIFDSTDTREPLLINAIHYDWSTLSKDDHYQLELSTINNIIISTALAP